MTQPRPCGERHPTDWALLRERLTASAVALACDGGLSAERRQEVLRERARRLARPLAKESYGPAMEAVVFALGSERFAFEAEFVLEVAPMSAPAPVPGTTDSVLGIVAIRGRIVSVVDLRRLLGVGAGEGSASDHLVILSNGRIEFAVPTGAVCGVERLPLSSISPPLPTIPDPRRSLAKGIAPGPILILDAPRLLEVEGVPSAGGMSAAAPANGEGNAPGRHDDVVPR